MPKPKPTEVQIGEALHNMGARAQDRVARSRLTAPYRYAKGAVSRGVSRAAGAPVRAAHRSLASLALGKKAKRGPFRGKRMHAVEGGPGRGMREISMADYDDIKEGRTKGKAYKGRIGGKTYRYARKFRPGGAVGMAMKHPLLAGGGALAAYWLAKKPENRQAASAMGGAMMPRQQINASLAARLRQQHSVENPLAREVWQ